jgi:hypothetical protein
VFRWASSASSLPGTFRWCSPCVLFPRRLPLGTPWSSTRSADSGLRRVLLARVFEQAGWPSGLLAVLPGGAWNFPRNIRAARSSRSMASWNRAPMPQEGCNVTFQPFANGKPSGNFEVFATGFAGKTPLMNPNDAVARADGVAQAPDGSLYIGDSRSAPDSRSGLNAPSLKPAIEARPQ